MRIYGFKGLYQQGEAPRHKCGREGVQMSTNREIVAPGAHYLDPSKQEIDPIGFMLERLQALLLWIEEHRSGFEQLHGAEPINAEKELYYLKNSTEQAVMYLQRLTDLLLAGYTIDPKKQLPKGLDSKAWQYMVSFCLQQLDERKPKEDPKEDGVEPKT